MVRVKPAELVQEPLQQESRTALQPVLHILEDMVRKPEQHMSERLEHKRASTPQEHSMKEPSVHTREHKMLPEPHSSVWPCSKQQRHMMTSLSKDQVSEAWACPALAGKASANPVWACTAWEVQALEV